MKKPFIIEIEKIRESLAIYKQSAEYQVKVEFARKSFTIVKDKLIEAKA